MIKGVVNSLRKCILPRWLIGCHLETQFLKCFVLPRSITRLAGITMLRPVMVQTRWKHIFVAEVIENVATHPRFRSTLAAVIDNSRKCHGSVLRVTVEDGEDTIKAVY